MFRPRLSQELILKYTTGKMGVSAVPGSGKTHTLSMLAAQLLTSGAVAEDQEVLIVTLVNSAVENFSSRIAGFVQAAGLLPNMGYRVRTLHGLAHDIVRERPDLVNLSDRFQIIDERESDLILRTAVDLWLRTHPEFILDYTKSDIDLNNQRQHVLRDWSDEAIKLARSFIRQAKDLQYTPQQVLQKIEESQVNSALLAMGSQIYSDYQRALNYRSALDFDDLIRLALQAMQSDAGFTERLRFRWPFILEDEAQDSSRLQEEILRLLAGQGGNWVRVGDPNQAIFETFTTASPFYLRRFLREPGVISRDLPESGRSSASVIALANHLIDWSVSGTAPEHLRGTLTPPLIEPTAPGDPQPNPADDPAAIYLGRSAFAAADEIKTVVRSLKKWLPEHPDQTVAVLVPRNERGAEIVAELAQNGIQAVELLQSSVATRKTANLLASVVSCLADPSQITRLSSAFRALHQEIPKTDPRGLAAQAALDLLKKCKHVEDFLWPRAGFDWLAGISPQSTHPLVLELLTDFRTRICRWQRATLLPIDQLLLTIAQDIFESPVDLALTYKLALLLEQVARAHPQWHLPEFALDLEDIARNKRKLPGFSDDDIGFDPSQHRGEVVVATIHKAKGLEWDRVYLLSVNNYDFPSALPGDNFISEKWFVRDQLNLQAELIAHLKALLTGDITGVLLEEGAATLEARQEYAAERLRLLFVGITRARGELIVTWNTGRKGNCTPALPLTSLFDFWEGRSHAAAD